MYSSHYNMPYIDSTFVYILQKRFLELTGEEMYFILQNGWVNGCWPAWFKRFNIHPPRDVFFDADCYHHDWGFLQGYHIRAWWRIDDILCAIIRKLECDCKFYYRMILDIFRLTDVKKIIYSLTRATIYFTLVVTCGWFSFNWRWVYTYY